MNLRLSRSRTPESYALMAQPTSPPKMLLGVYLSDHLNFNQQTKELCPKAAERSAKSCATSRSSMQNVHLSSLHTGTIQLLCVSVSLLRSNKHRQRNSSASNVGHFALYSSTLTATIRRFSTEPVYQHWSSHENEKSSSRSTTVQGCHAPVTTLHVGLIHIETIAITLLIFNVEERYIYIMCSKGVFKLFPMV